MKRATCSDRSRARGFTLLEMLVAITLLAVMAVIGWRALDSLTRSRERLTDHDLRLDALKVLYGQLQSDCEHLATASLLQASPLELGPGQLLMVRDRRDTGQPTAWQVIAYRLDGNTLVRAASPYLASRNEVRGALLNMRQAAGQAVQVRPLVRDVNNMFARAWVEPGGWQADTGRIYGALIQGNAAASAAAAANAAIAGATGASDAEANFGNVATATAIRAVELTIFARMGDGDSPRQFQKVCMTGL
ncbi:MULTISPECIES: PulJ/GspJ family protein [Cupriavidus]|jgi:general secretion pathway protein J|uniref:Prepilin-type N-terminal cleavage/methylation domain-containing protein n=1 Tax=Cupriavidus pauculus TaxID=82633 RepID=A0A5P2H5N7_9BURK|nr:prepilin-type N-terminal cleavage/methylation domain-containing protein [Cupriavidus pauculus]QET03371.1 prepilin-type N-terminal cleavage/methylation domain-containing protein [Cupriavidus pauculus]